MHVQHVILENRQVFRMIVQVKFHEVCAGWAPGAFSEDLRAKRMTYFLPFLQQYAIHSQDFPELIVAGEET